MTQLDRPAEPSQRLAVPSRPSLVRGSGPSEVAEQLVSLLAPDSFAADQYRALRHTMEGLRRESGLQVIAVTSAGPGDGKTVTTLNLAGALAQGKDARVLVVDADLRRPSVAKYLGFGDLRAPGLADLIVDPAYELDRVVRHFQRFNLSVLPAGVPQNNPYEFLNSPRLESLVKEARGLYNYVIVDTPPLLPMPDARLIGKLADGFLVIVGAHKTPRRLVSDALMLLDPAKLIGVVYNGDHQPLAQHYGYYGYYPTDADDRPATWWRRALMRGRH
jgi:capsular exopolysaccharide synthesis family protein